MKTFLISEGMMFRTLINDGVAIKFSILGKATEMKKYSILDPIKGSMDEVDVVSLLEQSGINEGEIGVSLDSFEVMGILKGDDLENFRNQMDNIKCMFVGRLNSKVSNLNYKQTFYIFRKGQITKEYLNELLIKGGD